jgi:hypothetical protein
VPDPRGQRYRPHHEAGTEPEFERRGIATSPFGQSLRDLLLPLTSETVETPRDHRLGTHRGLEQPEAFHLPVVVVAIKSLARSGSPGGELIFVEWSG